MARRRPASTLVRAMADNPTVARAYAPDTADAADVTHFHAGIVGRPYPCQDPRCAPARVPLERSRVTDVDREPVAA